MSILQKSELDRINVLHKQSRLSILQIINQLRSKVSFYGIIKLFDQNDQQKIINEKLQKENDLMKEMMKEQREMMKEQRETIRWMKKDLEKLKKKK